ncbi:MAG TPA: aldo/keto reductase, partial [Burkholderiaceae bacterium]|nr:aldo/keto reductase [Burkholderiaceae bacterium]
ERHHFHKPVVEQPQYHMFHRRRVEHEYARLYEDIGLGLTTWSPLASGLLTGKYRQGVPAGSRGAMDSMAWLREGLLHAERNAAVARLEPIAQELGGSLAQLAVAWAARNPRVSSVILGASGVGQLKENLGALALLPRLDAEVVARIEAIVQPLGQ